MDINSNPNSFEVPIMEEIAKMSDNGTPFVVALPETLDIVQTYTELAKKVDEEIKNKDDYDIGANYDPINRNLIVISLETIRKRSSHVI